ncbi:glycosyltransferase family 25 protein [Hydrogenimonas cancrithermarum]|uniref:Lipooligosaccharide biosynthesis protein LpsA n=1 Tax=Hydrogenimonas cancrithermarum TaxID=2993563 RepID=A0ABN6WY65_9BACT|nr:glycosyltransferase family 25 protein [Hydrogenimonas cancrithermarum]BDY13169.1 lipooligosaccharide biosynthesis protein LpsA [Hydrogenimonas cancrithermarum]
MIPLFVINLEEEQKKRKRIEEMLERLGLQYSIVKAVDGRKLTESDLKKVYSPYRSIKIFRRELSRGEVGCTLSHLSIYRLMEKEGFEKAVILEDDAVVCEDFPIILQHLEEVPGHCECLLLGYEADIKKELFTYTSLWGARRLFGKYRLKRFVKVALGAYGYMITKRGAQKILAANETIVKPLDHFTGDSSLLNLYGLAPRCVKVDEEGLRASTLDEERKELKKVLVTKRYNTFLGRWLNRIRLGIRLYVLKTLPLPIARRYALEIFRNRRRDD